MKIEYTLNEIDQVAKQLLEVSNSNIFLLYGRMGAGKTTLIKAMVKELGVTHTTNSPTFGLVNEYEGKNNTIYHFDLYRIEDEIEVLDMGFEDYLAQNAIIFIEWPEKILSFLPENCNELHLEQTETQRRIVAF